MNTEDLPSLTPQNPTSPPSNPLTLSFDNPNTFLDKIKINPREHVHEVRFFIQMFNTLKELVRIFPQERNEPFCNLVELFQKIYPYFREELSFLIDVYHEILKSHSHVLDTQLRTKMAQGLTAMSQSVQAKEVTAIKLFLDLLNQKAQDINVLALKQLFSLISKIDYCGKSPVVHRELIAHLAKKVRGTDFRVAKQLFKLLIALITKEVWKDVSVVNLIAEGTYHEDASIVFICCSFFLKNTQGSSETAASRKGESDCSQSFISGSATAKFSKTHKKSTTKNTKSPQPHPICPLAKDIKEIDELNQRPSLKLNFGTTTKKYAQSPTAAGGAGEALFITQIYSPSELADRIFGRLSKEVSPETSADSVLNFQVKLAMCQLISRILWWNDMYKEGYIAYLLHDLEPPTLHSHSEIMACLAGSCNPHTQPSELIPAIEEIITKYILECRSDHEMAIVGLNTLRQIFLRTKGSFWPQILSKLPKITKIKEKTVRKSLKTLLSTVRKYNPQLLGEENAKNRISGVVLLNEHLGTENIECERILTTQDYRRIKILEKQKIKDFTKKLKFGGGKKIPAIHMPDFDVRGTKIRILNKITSENKNFKEGTFDENNSFDWGNSDAGYSDELDDRKSVHSLEENKINNRRDLFLEDELEGDDGEVVARKRSFDERVQGQFEEGEEEYDPLEMFIQDQRKRNTPKQKELLIERTFSTPIATNNNATNSLQKRETLPPLNSQMAKNPQSPIPPTTPALPNPSRSSSPSSHASEQTPSSYSSTLSKNSSILSSSHDSTPSSPTQSKSRFLQASDIFNPTSLIKIVEQSKYPKYHQRNYFKNNDKNGKNNVFGKKNRKNWGTKRKIRIFNGNSNHKQRMQERLKVKRIMDKYAAPGKKK